MLLLQIKKIVLRSELITLICISIGCKTDVNINQYIDKNNPLKLLITNRNNPKGQNKQESFEIVNNSYKYKKLTAWGDANVQGWAQTPASYISDVFVGQGDFRLLIIGKGTGVVIGFIDGNKIPKQYTKKIENSGLDFLTK